MECSKMILTVGWPSNMYNKTKSDHMGHIESGAIEKKKIIR